MLFNLLTYTIHYNGALANNKAECYNQNMLYPIIPVILCITSMIYTACAPAVNDKLYDTFEETQRQISLLLENTDLKAETRYAAVNQIAKNLLAAEQYNQLILFLTDYVEKHPQDQYNAYWLLMVAHVYMQTDGKPFAEYYFDRILKQYPDLMLQNNSIHFLCLQNLIRISNTPQDRIYYFQQLINRFPNNVNTTELYYRLAQEYEKEGEWDSAIKSYELFLDQSDASSIQIAGSPEAYNYARMLIDFNNSPKDWTFESLEALEEAIKTAITRYNYRDLDKYKSKVNFFAMSWKQDATDTNSQEDFSMSSFMRGNRIRYNAELDESSNPNEAYLRTWGWSNYISVWYLYFRKVNFPADPEIHGRWEWAGIYFGEKL